MGDNQVIIYRTKNNNYLQAARSIEIRIPTSLRIYFCILLGFGIDSGFSTMFEGRIKSFVKYSSMAISTIMIVVLISSFNSMNTNVWYWTTIAEGIINFLILKKTTYDVYHFLTDMHNLGESIAAINNGIFGIVITIYTSGMFVLNVIFAIYRCVYERGLYCTNTPIELYAIYSVAYNTIDTVPVVDITICYYIYCHTKYLKDSVNTDFDIEKLKKRYIAIAECCEKIRPLYEQIVIYFLSSP